MPPCDLVCVRAGGGRGGTRAPKHFRQGVPIPLPLPLFSGMSLLHLLSFLLLWSGLTASTPPLSAHDVWALREDARELMSHAFSSYMQLGYPGDEVRPLTCRARTWDTRERGTLDDVLGGYALTLVDSLDTLALMGNLPAFRCAVSRIVESVRLDTDVSVSVFETSIRMIGGLLSAHLLSVDATLGIWGEGSSSGGGGRAEERGAWCTHPGAAPGTVCRVELGDPCLPRYSGELLSMALELGRRLVPAFNTPTGLPYHKVNLRTGAYDPASRETCTAAAGTYLIEFGLLSRLSGDPTFEALARRANAAIWARRSPVGLVGSAIDAVDGQWRSGHGGVGGGIDSWVEYLLKSAVVLNDEGLQGMADAMAEAVSLHADFGGVHLEVGLGEGRRAPKLPATLSSLQTFYPGVEVLAGDVDRARTHLVPLATLWGKYRAIPELYRLDVGSPPTGLGYGRDSPLRPELAESAFHLYTATRDASLLHLAGLQIQALNNASRTTCGFAAIGDVATGHLDDRMDSYFIAETAKYLFLTLNTALWHWFDGPPIMGGGGGTGKGSSSSSTVRNSSSHYPSLVGGGVPRPLSTATTTTTTTTATSLRHHLHSRTHALFPRAHPLAYLLAAHNYTRDFSPTTPPLNHHHNGGEGSVEGGVLEFGSPLDAGGDEAGLVAALPLHELSYVFSTEGHILPLGYSAPIPVRPSTAGVTSGGKEKGGGSWWSKVYGDEEEEKGKHLTPSSSNEGVVSSSSSSSSSSVYSFQCPTLKPAKRASKPPTYPSRFAAAVVEEWAEALEKSTAREGKGGEGVNSTGQCLVSSLKRALSYSGSGSSGHGRGVYASGGGGVLPPLLSTTNTSIPPTASPPNATTPLSDTDAAVQGDANTTTTTTATTTALTTTTLYTQHSLETLSLPDLLAASATHYTLTPSSPELLPEMVLAKGAFDTIIGPRVMHAIAVSMGAGDETVGLSPAGVLVGGALKQQPLGPFSSFPSKLFATLFKHFGVGPSGTSSTTATSSSSTSGVHIIIPPTPTPTLPNKLSLYVEWDDEEKVWNTSNWTLLTAGGEPILPQSPSPPPSPSSAPLPTTTNHPSTSTVGGGGEAVAGAGGGEEGVEPSPPSPSPPPPPSPSNSYLFPPLALSASLAHSGSHTLPLLLHSATIECVPTTGMCHILNTPMGQSLPVVIMGHSSEGDDEEGVGMEGEGENGEGVEEGKREGGVPQLPPAKDGEEAFIQERLSHQLSLLDNPLTPTPTPTTVNGTQHSHSAPGETQSSTFFGVGAGAQFGPLLSSLGFHGLLPAIPTPQLGCPPVNGATIPVIYHVNIEEEEEEEREEGREDVKESSATRTQATHTSLPPWVAVALRGGCSFVDKARVAQSQGASAIIVVDLSGVHAAGGESGGGGGAGWVLKDPVRFVMADDGNSQGNNPISIPSTLLSGQEALGFWRWLKVAPTVVEGGREVTYASREQAKLCLFTASQGVRSGGGSGSQLQPLAHNMQVALVHSLRSTMADPSTEGVKSGAKWVEAFLLPSSLP